MTLPKPERQANSLSRLVFSLRSALSGARPGMLQGHALANVAVLDEGGAQALSGLALGGGIRRVAVPRHGAAREAFVKQWLKENAERVRNGGLASTLLLPAMLSLAGTAEAAAPEMAPLAGQAGIASVTVLDDGRVEIVLESGRTVTLAAGDVVIYEGAVYASADALAALGLGAQGAIELVDVAAVEGVAAVTVAADGDAVLTLDSGEQVRLPAEAVEVRDGAVYAPAGALPEISLGAAGAEGVSAKAALIALGVLGVAAVAGSGGGSGGTTVTPPPPPPPPPETTDGFVIDGYLSGATVTRGSSSVTTDETGAFADLGGDVNAPITASGGVDISTGQNFTGTLEAPAGATVITPLTTLVQSLVASGDSLAEALATVQTAFGLPDAVAASTGDQSLLNFDPVAAASGDDADAAAVGTAVAKAGIQVATVLQKAAAGDAAEFARLADALAVQLKAAPVDLADATAVTNFLTTAEASAEAVAGAAEFALVASAIEDAATLEDAVTVQKDAVSDVPGIVPEGTEPPAAPVLAAVAPFLNATTVADGLALSGTATGADSVVVRVRSAANTLLKVAVVTDGAFALSLSAAELATFGEGAVSISARAQNDGAPLASAATTASVTIDTIVDGAPAATLTLADTLIGAAEADAVSFTVAGLDSDATAVASFTDGATTVTANVTADGAGTVDLSELSDGAITSSLAITDAAGNTATVAGTTVTLDQTVDAAPTASLTLADTLIGAAEADAVSFTVAGLDSDATAVASFTDGATTVTANVTADGAGTVDLSELSDGSITSSLTITDAAGNTATVAGTTVTLDQTADGAPTATLTLADMLIGAAEADAVSFTVAGLDSDATAVASFTDGTTTVTATVTADGAGTVDLSGLTDGAITSSLAITDAAGNTATVTGTSVTLDQAAPATPTVAFATETGATATLSSDKTLAITAEAGGTVTVFINGEAAGTATESATPGAYTFELDQADGPFAVAVQVTDAAGNSSALSTAKSLTLDTAAPDAPVLSLTQDTGRSSTDFITNNGSITVSGLEAGASYEFSVDGGSTYSAGTGTSFSVAAGTYAEGQVRVRQTDSAGNVSAEGQLTGFTVDDSFVVDQTAPAATITLAAEAVAVGATLAGEITFSEAPINFSSADITVPTGLSVASLTVKAGSDGKVYSLVLSADDNVAATDSAVVSLGVGFEDRAGNAPTEAVSFPAFAVTKTNPLVVGGDATEGVVFPDVETALLASVAGDTLRLEGDAYDLTDLSAAAVAAWQELGAIEVGTDATVTLTAAQATDQSVTAEGAGSLIVTDLDGTKYDFSNVTVADGTGVIQLASDNVTVSTDTNFGGLSVTVSAGQTLTATGAQLSTVPVSGEGAVAITDFAAAPAANYAALNAASVSANQSDTLTFTGVLGKVAITQAKGAELTLSAEGANGASISTVAEGSSTVTVTGVESALDADFSGLTATTVEGTVTTTAAAAQTFTGELGKMALTVAGDGIFRIDSGVDLTDASLSIASGAEFQATTAQLAALGAADVTGTGTVLVTNFAATTDLSAAPTAPNLVARVSSNLDITDNEDLANVDGYSTATGAELRATAAQVDGTAVTGTGSVVITDLAATPAADLSSVASTLASATATVSADLTFTGTLGDVALVLSGDAVLGLNISQADGAAVTGSGSVAVTGLTATADLSGLANSPSGAGEAITVTLAADADLTFTGNLGGAKVIIPAGASLTIGEGANVAGATFEVSSGDTLTLDAAVLDGSVSVVTPTGAAADSGRIVLNDVDATSDLSGISLTTGGGASAINVVANVAAATDLDVTAAGNRFDAVDSFVVPAGSSVTLTAAQANGLSITGDGSVTITEIDGLTGEPPEANFSGIEAATTIEVAGDVNLSSVNLGSNTTLTVVSGAELTLTAAQMNGATAVTGEGTLAVTGDLSTATGVATGVTIAEVDLSGATLGATFAFNGTAMLTVSAAQAAATAFSGDSDSETLVIDYTDAVDGTDQGTLDLEGVNLGPGDDTISFDFGSRATGQEPALAVTGTVDLGDGADLFEVFGGDVSTAGATLESVESFQFNSKVTLTLGTFEAFVKDLAGSVGRFLGSGDISLTGAASDVDNAVVDLSEVLSFVPGGIRKPTLDLSNVTNAQVVTEAPAPLVADTVYFVIPDAFASTLRITGVAVADAFTEATVDTAEITEITVFNESQLIDAVNAASADGSAIRSITLDRFVRTTDNIDFTALPDTVDLNFQNTLLLAGANQTVTVGLEQALGGGTNRFYVTDGTLKVEVGADPVAALGGTAPSNNVLFSTFPAYDTTLVVDDTGGNTVMNVTDLSVQRGWDFELAAGQTLQIADKQFAGKTVTGEGTVEVALSDLSYASLANSNANLAISASVAGDVNFFGDLAGADVTLADGASLALYDTGTVLGDSNVALATGATAGALSLNYFGRSASEDLSDNTIAAGITKLVTITSSGRFDFTGNFGDFDVQLADGVTLVASGATLAGVNVAGDGDSVGRPTAVEITGVRAAADFSGIATDSAKLVITGNANFATAGALPTAEGLVIQVLDNTTLTIDAAKLDGVSVIGAGRVALTGLDSSADLSGLKHTGGTSIALTEDTNLSNVDLGDVPFDLTIAADATLTLSAAQADGRSITGEGSVVVTTPSATPDADLSGIAADATVAVVSFEGLVVFRGDLGSASVDVGSGGAFSIAASSASGVAIANAGSLAIVDLARMPAGDFSNISGAGSATAFVARDLTFTGDLGPLGLNVGAGATFTASAAVLDGVAASGTGALAVTGLAGTPSADLSGLAVDLVTIAVAADAVFTGTLPAGAVVSVGASGSLTASAAKLAGVFVTGPGDVTATGLTATSDLSLLRTSGSVTGEVASGSVDLTGARLGVSGLDIAGGATVTLTAAQADGRTITGGGSLRITDAAAAPDADLSGIADSIFLIDTAPQVTLGVLGVNDVINADTVEGGVTVTGTVADAAGDALANQAVTLTVGDLSFLVLSNADGAFSVSVPLSVFFSVADGEASVTARTVVDGNVGSASRNFTLKVEAPDAPTLTLANDLGASDTDGITGDATINVGGLEDGASWQYSVDGGTTFVDGVGDSFTLAAGTYAAGQVQARQTDVAGNESPLGVSKQGFIIDLTAPAQPTLTLTTDTATAGDGITSEAEFALTAEAGSTVTLLADGEVVATAVPSLIPGGYTADLSAVLEDGTYQITAVATDLAGNASPAATPVALTLDTAAPANPTLNTVAGDGTVSAAEADAGVTLSGSAEAGLTVSVTWAGVTQTAVANAEGQWSTTFAAANVPVDGDYTITVAALTDAAGNSSAAGASAAVTVDRGDASIALATLAGDGRLAAAELDAPLTITGSASSLDGQTATVTLGGKSYTGAIADGAFSVTVPTADLAALGQGAQTVAVSVSGASGATASASLFVDTVAPTQPVIALVNDTGVAGDGVTSTVAFSITTTAGSSVELFVEGESIGFAQESATTPGTYRFTPPVTPDSDGPAVVTAVATDATGNVSATSAPLNITIDQAAPAQPTVALSSTFGPSTTLTITAEAGSTVTVRTVDDVLGTATESTSAPGTFTFTPSLPADGTYSFSAVATDLAGNVSQPSTAVSFLRDATAPAVDAALANGATAATSSAALAITAEPNATVEVLNGTTKLGNATAGTGGKYSFTPDLDDGAYSLTIRATDAAGNTATDTVAFTLDTTAPGKPTLALAQDTAPADSIEAATDARATLTSDGITSASTLTITAEAGSTVEVFAGTQKLGEATESSSSPGTFTFTPTVNGSFQLTAKATDAAGNVSAASDVLAVTLDSTPPAAPALALVTDSGVAGDGLTNVTAFEITAEADSYVAIFRGDATTPEAVLSPADATDPGVYRYTPVLSEGASASFTAQAIDVAGNAGAASAALAITLDTSAPTLSIADLASSAGTPTVFGVFDILGIQTDGELVLSGTTDDVSPTQAIRVTVTAIAGENRTPLFGGQSLPATVKVVDGSATWSRAFSADSVGANLPLGSTIEVAVNATDDAGNAAAAPVLGYFTVNPLAELAAGFQAEDPVEALTTAAAGQGGVSVLSALGSLLEVSVNGLTIDDLGDERLADLVADVRATSLSSEVEADPDEAIAALMDYRLLLESLKDVASEDQPNYAAIDFEGVVSPIITNLEGLVVDGALVTAQNVADATTFLGEIEALRDTAPGAFEATAEFAIALNLGTVTDAAAFEQLLVNWRDALAEADEAVTLLGLGLNASAVDIYINAFQGLAPASQAIMAAPFLETDTQRPRFTDFSNPKLVLKQAFLDGLINEAGLVRAEILEQVGEDSANQLLFNTAYDQTIEALKSLRNGILSVDDFGPQGSVQFLAALLEIAESPVGGELSADFAGIPVAAAQVQRGLDLFEAFAFDVLDPEADLSFRPFDDNGVTFPFPGEAALLKAMNDPEGLLLLSSPSDAARVAVQEALKAEFDAVVVDGEVPVEAEAGLIALLGRVTNVIDNISVTEILDGVDLTMGSAADDVLTGSIADDILVGGAGDDTLVGGSGDDTLLGGAGNDRLDGGVGNDFLDGNLGSDTFVIAASDNDDEPDVISGFNVLIRALEQPKDAEAVVFDQDALELSTTAVRGSEAIFSEASAAEPLASELTSEVGLVIMTTPLEALDGANVLAAINPAGQTGSVYVLAAAGVGFDAQAAVVKVDFDAVDGPSTTVLVELDGVDAGQLATITPANLPGFSFEALSLVQRLNDTTSTVETILDGGANQALLRTFLAQNSQDGEAADVFDDFGDERKQDFVQDLLDNRGAGYTDDPQLLEIAGPLFDYRELLEFLKGVAESGDYAAIDFLPEDLAQDEDPGTDVSSVIGDLAGLTVDGGLVTEQDIAGAQTLIQEFAALRDSDLTAYNATAEFAIDLNIGAIDTADEFEALITNWQSALSGQTVTLRGFEFNEAVLNDVLTAFRALSPTGQDAVLAPFAAKAFLPFTDPSQLFREAIIDGLIAEAELLLADAPGSVADAAIGLLEALRDGDLTVADFAPAGSPVALFAAAIDSNGGQIDLGPISITSAQVEKGIALFEAFGDDGDAVLLAAMNDPANLRLLTDPSGAARDAVLDAIAAEVKDGGTAETVFATLGIADPQFTSIITGEDAPRGTDANEILVGGGTQYSEGGTDLVYGGTGPDLFVIDLNDDGVDIIADFSRDEFVGDALGFQNGRADEVGTGVFHQGVGGVSEVTVGDGDDIGLYVIADLSGQSGINTAEQVANYLDASALFDDENGDDAFVIAPNADTVENTDDAVLYLATDTGTGATELQLVAQFAVLDFGSLLANAGDDIIQENGF